MTTDPPRAGADRTLTEPPLVLTPGPWGWRQPGGSRRIGLCTIGRGMLYVLDPARAGMNDATIRFGHRTSPRHGGLLQEVPVRPHEAPDFLTDPELTPDARLIQAAPELLDLMQRILTGPGRASLPEELAGDAARLVERIVPSGGPAVAVRDGESTPIQVARFKDAGHPATAEGERGAP